MVRVLFASDLQGDFGKYQAIVNHGNAHGIDALFLGGDFVDGAIPGNGGKQKLDSAHARFINDAVTSVLTEEEIKNLQGLNPEELQKTLQELIKDKKEPIAKQFYDCVEKYELNVIKQILSGYNGRKVGVLGNHDPEFLKKSLEGIVEFVDDGIVDIHGIKISGLSDSYEPSAAASVLPELYPHIKNYKPTNDEEITKETFSKSENPADVYLFHRGVTNRFAPDQKNVPYTHDYNARKLVEEARVSGKDPLVLSGHFHHADGGREKGIFQLKPGMFVYELNINDKSKQLVEIVIYKYVQDMAEKKAA